jgi:hypothetical protein
LKRSHKRVKALAALGMLCLVGAAPARREWAWEGHYASLHRVASVAHLPVIGAQRSVTHTLLLVDIERQGGRWVQRQRVCDVSIHGSRARMTIPDAFVRSLPERSYAATMEGGGAYVADGGVESIGFDPRVTGGALPATARAAGVLDSDGDGEPGATVIGHFPIFGKVRLFIAQRTHVVLRGRQVGPDRIEGTVDVLLLEQRTLGASNGIFRRSVEVKPDPGRSGFTMLRTTARDCDELKRAAGELFPG